MSDDLSALSARVAALEQRILGSQTIYYPKRTQKQASVPYTVSQPGKLTMLKSRPILLDQVGWSTLATWKSIDVSSYVPRAATHVLIAVKSFFQDTTTLSVRGDSTYDSFPVAYGTLQTAVVESYAASGAIVELSNWAFEFYIDAASMSGTQYSIQLVGYYG